MPADYLSRLLQQLNLVAKKVLQEELDALLIQPSETRSKIEPASPIRLSDGPFFQIESIREGSVVITGIVAGTGVLITYFLANTIGHSATKALQDAWEKTELHHTVYFGLISVLQHKLGSRKVRVKEAISNKSIPTQFGLQLNDEGDSNVLKLEQLEGRD